MHVRTRTRRREEKSNPKFLFRRLEQPAIPPTYDKYRLLSQNAACSSTSNNSHYVTLHVGWMPASRHPALRPQHGASAQPQQTSRSVKPLESSGKLQEKKTLDVLSKVSIAKKYNLQHYSSEEAVH